MNTEKDKALARVSIKSNDMLALQTLLRDGFDFTEKTISFPSALSTAVTFCNLEALKLMQKCNKTKFLDYINKEQGLLHKIYSIDNITMDRRRSIIKYLLENGLEIKKADDLIIQNIVYKDDSKTFELLYNTSKGQWKRINFLRDIFYNSFSYLSEYKLAKFLFPKFSKSDIDKLIERSISDNNTSVIKFLFQSVFDKSFIVNKNINIYTEFLPRYGGLPEQTKDSLFKLLINAEKNGEIKTHIKDRTGAAVNAAQSGLFYSLSDILDLGVNINFKRNGSNLLILAADNETSNDDIDDKFKIIKKLIKLGIDPLCTDNYGDGILHILVQNQYHDMLPLIDLFDFLVKNGVDINRKNRRGQTVAHLIASETSPTRKKLLEHIITKLGADMSIKDNDGNNILIIACLQTGSCKKTDAEVVELILKHSNCDINDTDADGTNVVGLALYNNNFEIAKYLLTQDINLMTIDKYQKTVYNYLEEWKFDETYNIMCDLIDKKLIDSKKHKSMQN